ncbi:HAD-IC family P-type ATPase [Sulfuritalea sp.]|uniref:HAD-IC family P-type ATPase n=1 Tax=Sulfuritalea sp. TaxID=2480090 RepID=UPI00286E83E4|nr:HAD-IC family P-type ATPase [Sulfuritalea sp.]
MMTSPSPSTERDRLQWHALPATEALVQHGVAPEHGLGEAEAAERLLRHGPNRPSQQPGRSALTRFLAQLKEPLVLVLIGSGIVTSMLGEWVDSSVIFGVVVINAVIGYLQESKAEAALAALAQALATEVTVLRAGRRRRIDAVHLVPGDVVWLTAGDKVPADLRIISGKQLRTVEAQLTGEAAPIDKHHEELPEDTALADRRNMAYAGTTVVAGQGHGLVVATADATETGRISGLIASAPEIATPLTKKMGEFAGLLLWVILGLAALTFVIGVARGQMMTDMLMAAVALAVGAIPEGLPAAMSITLAIGVGRMAKRRAIIRHLPAVEALGSTTVICSDKTGTLTENAMTVTELWAGGEAFIASGQGYKPEGELLHHGGSAVAPAPSARDTVSGSAGDTTLEMALHETLLAGVLCNDAALYHEHRQWQITGDPTEAALLVVAKKGGLDEATLRSVFPRRDELPFDSARQTMATLHEIEGQAVAYVKGAIEKLLPACRAMLAADGSETALETAALEAVSALMAARGLRVLALARRHLAAGERLNEAAIGNDLVFLGLVGMIDPPRARAISAVRTCHAAGIVVKMITGDHAETARSIAAQIGIVKDAHSAEVLTGRDLARLDDQALKAAALRVDVFARVEPEQKLRLVRALQAQGEVVAMTGDGINDAPALKQADIGIAMGLGGTDVAKEAAAMVLTDDNFATIEAAVEEGRGIYDNLVKFITWTLPTNFGEGLVILAAIVAGVTLPITPLQILWINMTTAVLLGLPLAFEPAERGIMHRPPRPPGSPVLDGVLIGRIVLVGSLMLAGSFGMFLLAGERGQSMAEARTIAMNVFVAIETVYLFNCRSLRLPVTAVAAFSNPWIWAGAGLQLALQLAITYWAPLNAAFATAPIDARAWGEIAVIALVAMLIIEIEKRLRRR